MLSLNSIRLARASGDCRGLSPRVASWTTAAEVRDDFGSTNVVSHVEGKMGDGIGATGGRELLRTAIIDAGLFVAGWSWAWHRIYGDERRVLLQSPVP